MQHPVPFIAGLFFLCIVLLDAFQTIILPRRPAGRFRITRLFFIATWGPWKAAAKLFPLQRIRDQIYSIFGPLSLLILMSLWAALLISAFALIFYGLGTPLQGQSVPEGNFARFRECVYISGSTLFTLGLGDVTPTTHAGRIAVVAEAGVGLGFIALVIGYVPVLYGAFSHREVSIALLDARAGSPPTAGELLVRHSFDGGDQALVDLLAEWERWCAEMLESHISYPILCYYRSQHDNQSWLSSITAILDTCALLITSIETPVTRQAQLTFAIARHTLVDLGHVFHVDARIQELLVGIQAPGSTLDRLCDADFERLSSTLTSAGIRVCSASGNRQRLASIRLLYEPQAQAMSEYLLMDLPQWTPAPRDPSRKPDQWTTVDSLRAPVAPPSHAFAEHVSTQSTASRLHDEDFHAF